MARTRSRCRNDRWSGGGIYGCLDARKKLPLFVGLFFAVAILNMRLQPEKFSCYEIAYPACLPVRLGADAPPVLTALGNLDLLKLPKTALFCSACCPGNVILTTYDQAAQWRDASRCIISGFHSPVEKECLQILLRGDAPVILCPARGMLERLPAQWTIAVASGRMLILSAFAATAARITAELAARRNEFVAALADEVYIAHANPGGQLEKIIGQVKTWRIPFRSPTETGFRRQG